MKNIIIIGAGQLGSRHLQGVLKYNKETFSVYLLDPSFEALNTSKDRGAEIEHNHTLYYISENSKLPKNAEVAIIATNSNVREFVVSDLLLKTSVKHIILEKVLFQELEAYNRFKNLLNKYNSNVYVNHPRRLTPAYISIANKIKEVGGRSFFSIVGENWDLGCNALHMIDLFAFLSHSAVKSISTEGIDTAILESKRQGYVEFTGTITGLMENNDAFSITSLPGERGPLTLQIATNGNRWLVQEGGIKTVLYLEAANNFAMKRHDFFQDFQSNLTTQVIADLLENKTCGLSSYDEAAHTHKVFITALLEKYNSITNLNEIKCPIT
jgi:hypothetical protein